MKTIDQHISNDVDDVEENTFLHTIDYDNATIEWGLADIWGGFIFKDVKIRKRSEIISAMLTVKHIQWNITLGGTAFIYVYGWEICDILNWQFPPLEQTPSGCPHTAIASWFEYTGVTFPDGLISKELDVTAIIQRLVNQGCWRKECDIGLALRQGVFPRRSRVSMRLRDSGGQNVCPRLTVMVKPKVLLTPQNSYEGVVY